MQPHILDVVCSGNPGNHCLVERSLAVLPQRMQSSDEAAMVAERSTCLREWGRRRERRLHRAPICLMDQMLSGSGYYPVRLLEDKWFTEREKAMACNYRGYHRASVQPTLSPNAQLSRGYETATPSHFAIMPQVTFSRPSNLLHHQVLLGNCGLPRFLTRTNPVADSPG